jgi:hypothetical protein
MPGLVVSERLSERGPIDLETVPYFGPAYHPGLAGCALRHLNAPLVVLSIVACPAGSVVRFNCSGFSSRFRPTFTRRTPREGAVSRSPGRQGLPRTSSAGLLRYRLRSIIYLHGYAVTKVKRLPPLSLHPCGQFRANRSHTPRLQDMTMSFREK